MTKTFSWSKARSQMTATPYPLLQQVTSEAFEAPDLDTFANLVSTQASLGHCLLKGSLDRPLVNESRAGHANDDHHEWVVFDFDRVDCAPSIEGADTAIRKYLPAYCHDVDCLIQLSSSTLRPDASNLSAHVFMLLETSTPTKALTNWLTAVNFTEPLINELRLTDSGMALRYPLDRSVTSPAKLIYIAPPRCVGFEPRLDETLSLVDRGSRRLVLPDTTAPSSIAISVKINELRGIAGLPAREWKTREAHGMDILIDAEECVVHDIRPSGDGFIRFNMNGGDSHAYFINVRKPALVGNFKGEPYMQTSQVAPDLFKQLTKAAHSLPAKIPPATIEPLAFYATNRQSTIYIGSYDREHDDLRLDASSMAATMSWLSQFGLPKPARLPHYDLVADMTSPIRFEDGYPIVNLYKQTEFIKQYSDAARSTACTPASLNELKTLAPVLHRIMLSAVGGIDAPLLYFVNWLAAIFQRRDRTMSAWVLHGRQGCLSGDTVLQFTRGKKMSARPLTIREAWQKWTGVYPLGKGRGRTWDMSLSTRTKSVRDGMTIGYHEVLNIVESGFKQLYRVTTTDGHSIRVTCDHPFMRIDGSFTALNRLEVGDEVLTEGSQIKSVPRGGRRRDRVTIEGLPYHPYAWKHMSGGRDYRRCHRARLVVEADMNHLGYEEFLNILRTDPERAELLQYLRTGIIVHHIDEDPTNDDLTNLTAIDKANHDSHHAKEVGLGFIATNVTTIASIVLDAREMTYDITMKAPYHNYVANGFVVHNTGKGLLLHHVIRPLFGEGAVAQSLFNLLNTDFNAYMEGKLIVVFDETALSKATDWSGIRSKLYDWITEPRIPIHSKGKDVWEARNFSNILLFSNDARPVMIEDGDRRFNVGEFQENRLFLNPNEFATLAEQRELIPFAKFLGSMNVNDEMLIKPYSGDAKERILEATHSLIDAIGRAIKAGDVKFFVDNRPDAVQLRTDFNGKIIPINEYNTLLQAMLDDKLNMLNVNDLYTLFRVVALSDRTFPETKAQQRRIYQRYGLLGESVLRCNRTSIPRRGVAAPKWKISGPLRKEMEEMLHPHDTNVIPIRKQE